MGKLRPAPAGYSIVKLPEVNAWIILVLQRNRRAVLVDTVPLKDEQGRVRLYARRSVAVTDAMFHALASENERLQQQLAQVAGSDRSGESLAGVS